MSGQLDPNILWTFLYTSLNQANVTVLYNTGLCIVGLLLVMLCAFKCLFLKQTKNERKLSCVML